MFIDAWVALKLDPQRTVVVGCMASIPVHSARSREQYRSAAFLLSPSKRQTRLPPSLSKGAKATKGGNAKRGQAMGRGKAKGVTANCHRRRQSQDDRQGVGTTLRHIAPGAPLASAQRPHESGLRSARTAPTRSPGRVSREGEEAPCPYRNVDLTAVPGAALDGRWSNWNSMVRSRIGWANGPDPPVGARWAYSYSC